MCSTDFAHYNSHPGVCNKLITICAARYPLMIRCNLSSTFLSVKHIHQDISAKAQNRTCKQPLMYQSNPTFTIPKGLCGKFDNCVHPEGWTFAGNHCLRKRIKCSCILYSVLKTVGGKVVFDVLV